MKRKLLQLIMIATLLLSGIMAYAQQWAAIGSVAFSPSNINLSSVAIGKNDTPYIAYLDYAHNDAVSVMKYNGSSWVFVGSPGFSHTIVPTGVDKSLILKIDNTGKPYVFFEDSLTPPFSLMSFDGNAWSLVDSAGIVNAALNVQSDVLDLAIDGNGNPYISFVDNNQSYKGSVMEYTGGAWTFVGPQKFTPGSADFMSLAIDHNNTPWLAFSDGSVNGRVSVQKFNGGNWLLQGQEGFSGGQYGVEYPVSLTFDNNNIPYIAYDDDNNSDAAYVKQFNGSDWVAVGDTDFSVMAAYYLTLSITSGNVPVVSYSDFNNNKKATVKYFNGAIWADLGTPDFSSGEADWVSLAINSRGVPFVGFVDDVNGYTASVYSFGVPAGISTVADVSSSIDVYPNPNSGSFTVRINGTEAGEMTAALYDLVGQQVWSSGTMNTSGNYSTTVNTTDMTTGTYVLQVKTNGGVKTQKLEIVK